MITVETLGVYGFKEAIHGMRNPKNSWSKSDSKFDNEEVTLGPSDYKLAVSLAKAGTDHGKYLRFINAYCDLTAPLYWLKEMDTYRFGVEKNSCSTMHKITDKEFEMDDFSHERLGSNGVRMLSKIVDVLNYYRRIYYNSVKEDPDMAKAAWFNLIQMLPSSYNQRRTYMFSYAALKNIYRARKGHKLPEWKQFLLWIETLPYSELITGEKENG